MSHMRRPLTLLGLAGLWSACGGEPAPDAYGNFEATEVVVAAETAGRLEAFNARDGQRLAAGAEVALVDTVRLSLERSQVAAQRDAGAARAREAGHQVEGLAAQLEIAERGYARVQRLQRDQAATAQQIDQAERDVRVLGEQLGAARAQGEAARHEVVASAARLAEIDHQLSRSRVTNPRDGTVLTTYAERGEYVQPGQPLYKLAFLDSLELRAYLSEPQLATVRLGQPAEVTVDAGGAGRRTFPGTVSWIAAEAEFTPTPVQTREERADLVYAVKILVANPDGALKIGMPADVRFPTGPSTP